MSTVTESLADGGDGGVQFELPLLEPLSVLAPLDEVDDRVADDPDATPLVEPEELPLERPRTLDEPAAELPVELEALPVVPLRLPVPAPELEEFVEEPHATTAQRTRRKATGRNLIGGHLHSVGRGHTTRGREVTVKAPCGSTFFSWNRVG
jgi:hypothetical protein